MLTKPNSCDYSSEQYNKKESDIFNGLRLHSPGSESSVLNVGERRVELFGIIIIKE